MANPQSHVVDAYITYVDKEGPLIKLFAQIDKKNACIVERLLYQIRDVLETTDLKPKSMNDIYIGLVCCAKYDDGVYYRARIVSLDDLKDYKVSVVFIDHGNKTEVKVVDLKLISKLLQVYNNDSRLQCLKDLQSLAEEFYLIGIAPKEKEWDESTLDFLRKKLCNTDLKCAVLETEGKKLIKILQQDYDPTVMLINLNRGFPVPLNSQERFLRKTIEKKAPLPEKFSVPPPSVTMQHPPPKRLGLPNMTLPPPVRMMHEGNSLPKGRQNQSDSEVPRRHALPPGIPIRMPQVQTQLPPVQSLQFSTEMLAPGVTHPVFVSHVEDGPICFAVQLQKVVQEVLIQMMADLNNHEPQPITAPLNPGSICLGRYSEDKSLCRAIVMNVCDDKAKLYFADFGNSEVLPYSEIFQIPPQFVSPKVMSHRFTLANIQNITYTDQEKKRFKDLVANCRTLMMKVTPPEANPLKQYCELFVNCKNVKQILQELAQSQQPALRYVPSPLPMKGSQEKVFVSFVLNPGRFFVQLEKNSFLLKQIMSCVANHCLSAAHIPLVSLQAGEPCCALYEDEQWYRAEIIKINSDNKALINFVDYGNQEEIELANLRQITAELVSSVKSQALVCCLKGYELRYDVSEEVSNRLEEIILEKKLMMHVLTATGNGVLIVQLMDENGGDIGVMLETKPSQSPIYNNYQATATPAYEQTPKHATNNDGWGGNKQASPSSNTWEEQKGSDSRGPSGDDGKKSWRNRDENESAPRFNKEGGGRWNDNSKPERRSNKEGDDKPWNKGGGRFNREEDGSGDAKFNRDDSKKFGERGESRFGRSNDDRGGRFNKTDDDKPFRRRDDDSGGWRSNKDREDGGSWKDKESSGGRNKDRDSGGGWKDKESGGGWKDKESGGGWKDKESGGGWKDKESGGGWKDKESGGGWKDKESGGGWKDKESGGGWKPREGGSSGGWNKDREGGGGWKDGGERKSKFDSDSGFKRGGGFNRDSGAGDRSSFRKPWEKGDSFGGGAAPKTTKPNTVGGMPQSSVKVGITEDTQVVYTASPLEFYVQLTRSFEELNQLMEKIATSCESGEVANKSDVQDKSGCLAKYSEDDTWYRAYVEEKSFDSAKVLFVDYGNQENVPFDKIKELPEDMTTLPVQAVKCRLLGVPESAEVEAFTELVDGKTLKTQFVAMHFLTKSFQVVMVDETSGSNINTAMGASDEEIQAASLKLGLTTLTAMQYSAGTTLTAQMTWYLSPSQFHLQPMASNQEFRAMMQCMQSLVKTGTVRQNNQLNVGDFVIARFKADKVLYRALVKESGFAPTVQYVDYGNTELVDSGSVWSMEPQYATLPMQAFSCCLAGVQPKDEAWPKPDTSELDTQFEAETLECCVVKELEVETQYLVKLVKNGEDVAQKIIDAGFAVADSNAVSTISELDTSLLVSQCIPVSILRVQEDCVFYVQPSPTNVELQSLEAVSGEGIKCTLTSVKEDASDEQRAQLKQLPPATNGIVLVDAVQPDGLQVTLYDEEGVLLPLQSQEVTSVSKICPLPVLNTHQRVWLAHASQDGIFLHKTVFAELVTELLQKLYDFYNETEYVEQDLAVGQICCAKSITDDQWYRARLLETGEETKVQFVDYGNSEIVPVSNLRKLDPSFYTPHAFALKVSLHVSWSVPVENLLELAGEKEYNAVVLRSEEGWVVELVDGAGQSLTEKLVELGFAVALDNSPFKRVVEGGRFVEGSEIPVSVSVIDSPLQLWILVGDDIELIEGLQDRLQEAAPKLSPLKLPSGIFAAKFSDGSWYRATHLNDSTVRFIDYGNSDTVDMSDIKTLSADFLEPAEGYAVKVELPVADYKEGATERLDKLLVSPEIDTEEDIIAHILSVKESFIVADIFIGGESVVDTLVEENLASRVQSVFSGFISNLNSPNDFFVQQSGCEEQLETMSNVMLSAESFEARSETVEGDIVAALYPEDDLWYRAKVIKKSEDGVEVLFIDYGNSSTTTEFRSLPSDLASQTALSKHCALQLPSGIVEWSESAHEKFLEISADGCTQFDVKALNQSDPATVILSYNGSCVNEELKSLCDMVEQELAPESKSVEFTGYDKNVYISHVNSPNSFYVQVEGTEVDLDAIKEELIDVSSFVAIDQITDDIKEKIIGALYADDELWYRAKVLNTSEDGTEVLFVDYGNSAEVTKLVKLPETLENKPCLSIHCALGKEDWSEKANEYFVELSGGGSVPFRMKILEETEPNIVSLIVEDKIVEQELLSLTEEPLHKEDGQTEVITNTETAVAETETSEDKTKSKNIIKTVFLIQVNSPSDFFLHTTEDTQLIVEITEKLLGAEDFPSVEESNMTKGNIVAAQLDEDDLWYRARIIDNSESETKVLLIDYGNTAKVPKVKCLPEDLASTPPLAMHCCLEGAGSSEWSLKACETFNKLANDDNVSFDLEVIAEGEPNLVALYINGESVAEQLILISGLVTKENERTDENGDVDLNGSSNVEEVNKDDVVVSYDENAISEPNQNISENGLKTVKISHFNSSNDFYVQFINDDDGLTEIKNEMAQAEDFDTMLEAEEILAAKCTSEGLWFRAKILDTSSSGSTVLFVDYGSKDITNVFRKLPKHLAEKKPLAKHCCLKSPRGAWSKSTDDNLLALTRIPGCTFDVKVLEEGDPCIVDLLAAGCSLMESFSDQEFANNKSEMGEMVLQSVESKISNNTLENMKHITDDLVFIAASSSGEKVSSSQQEVIKAKSVEVENMKHITDDLVFNAASSSGEKVSSSQQEVIKAKSDEVENSTTGAINSLIESNGISVEGETNCEKVCILDKNNTKESSSNHVTSEDNVNTSAAKDGCNRSPPTPRRSNIDEHIVPGCISSVKFEQDEPS